MAIFGCRWTRMLRGPVRRAVSICGGRRSRILSKYFDLQLGTVYIPVQTLRGSVFHNIIQASGWNWQSYDKICQAYNVSGFSNGELVPSGSGPGTIVTAILNTVPIVCTAYLVDSTLPSTSGG